jgi:5-methylcytosine-specific restriction endonuclease McrA
MQNYTLTHLSDAVLLRDLVALVAQDRVTTAMVLAHIAEVDARRLYAPAGYPSMHAYCVDELRLSEDAAKKRIQAARAARQFPAIFHALAEGQLHLTGVCLLAPHLTLENARGLIESATHRRKTEIEEMLASRFQLQEPAGVRSLTPFPSELPPTTAHVGEEPRPGGGPLGEGAPEHLPNLQIAVSPASPERYLLRLTIAKSTHDKLRHAQALLSHAVPTGDAAQVLDRALDALITHLERRKIGAITHPQRRRRLRNDPVPGGRYVPAQVRRAVWERDQGQCTFVSASGTRCKSRRFLEFDHVDPVARGGGATVERMRLRCRAHNQYEAERAFGAEFMKRKHHEARCAAAEAKAQAASEEQAAAREKAAKAQAIRDEVQDVFAGLRNLGCRANEARRAAEFSETLQDATLEERMRAALMFLSRGSIQAGTSAECRVS